MFGNRPANHRASRVTILVAAFVAAVIAAILVYLAAVAPRGIPTRDYYDIDAAFKDTADIKLLSSVTVNGKRIGQVSKIRSDGEVAHLNLQLDPGTELRADSTARIRVKNPVGAKYVNIDPAQTGDVIPDDGSLPVSQTSTAIDTPDLLSTFDTQTQANLSTGVGGLGRGFLGRGQDINETLPKSPELLQDSQSVSEAILARKGAAARFFPSLDSLAAAYDPVREDLAAGFTPQADVFEAFADEGVALQDTLEEAPPALTALRDGLNKSVPLLNETAGFARATTRLTVPLPGALREATQLLRVGAPALRDTEPLLDALGDAVDPTIAVLNDFQPEIHPTIRALRTQLQPLEEFARHKCDVLAQAANWRSALGYGVPVNTDPTSELDFSQGIGNNNNSFRVLGVPPNTTEALLPDAGIPSAFSAPNAYPAPCVAKDDVVR
jgi:virulence factor Mce-like protein